MDRDDRPGNRHTPAQQPTVETGASRLRVLVADDHKVVRSIMVRMVADLGHDADAAVDGQETVEALAENRYDLLLLDLSMPRLTGVEVVRWLHTQPERSADLHVVVISAWAEEERADLHALGVTTVLPKPFRRQQLADLISGILAGVA